MCDNKVSGDGLESQKSAYSYALMNITGVPVNIMMGLCLPDQCHESDFRSFTSAVTNSINSLLDAVDERKIPFVKTLLPDGLNSVG
jgi:hypothetical protein